jgi:hypothetical protein
VFKSNMRGVLAAAALAVGVLGSATSAQASAGVPPAQSDIIAILKSDVGSAEARKAGGTTQDILFVRKAGGHQGE